jgi:acetolactate synthase-1/2/3 large subunit
MKGVDAIATILKREGVEYLFCFPNNSLIDACARAGIRPIMARTERTLINMADGYSRTTHGERVGVAVVQAGPGSENAFGGVAQAYADSVPILLLPGGIARQYHDLPPTFQATRHYGGVTKWVGQINMAARAPAMLQRAFSLLRMGHPRPVMLEIPTDVASEEIDDTFDYTPPRRVRSAGGPDEIAAAAQALLAAQHPILHVGQGALYAQATEELIVLAELLQVPVMTTMAGKSAFPENHPLSIGAGGRTVSGMVKHFLTNADLVCGLGCSFSIEFSTLIPRGKVLIQNTIDESDINKHYTIDYAIIGDCKLVVRQLIDAVKLQLGEHGRRDRTTMAQEIRTIQQNWLAEWMPKLTSDEIPINPYRVIWDMMQVVDRATTIITHDSGNPRDQLVPFYEAVAPGGYIGWGKSTQLGYGLGLIMGAKLAAPARLCVNVMGDGAFGMAGMDFETAARERIPILTILLNNSALGGYEKLMPVATERYRLKYLSGEYAKVAQALGGYGERVERPADIIPAIQRAQEQIAAGKPALLEVITREEGAFSMLA